MVTANKTSRACWAYETTPGTAEISAADSTSYWFGEYKDDCGKWNSPFIENSTVPYWLYSSRTPTLVDIESTYPTFTWTFNPTTIQWLAWMLKYPTDTDPTVTVAALSTGQVYPLTIRLEEKGGTNEMLTQAVGCYCVGATAIAERNKAFMVECEFAWQSLEDQGDRAILTTAPTISGGLDDPYMGNPIVVWDSGGTPISLTPVWRADFKIGQNYEIVSTDEGATQTVYCHTINPVQIILYAVFETNDLWDDYIDRVGTYEMTLQVKKADNTSYQTFTFHNCRVKSIKKTGERNKGHYASVATIIAEKVEGVSDFFTEGGANFSTHFKAAVS